MVTDDQSAVLDFLSDPASYPDAPAAVDRIDTHAAIVFLAGDRAYKIKRAVRYDYLDFSTLDRRRRACEAELRLNRRTAPDLYLTVQPISRADDGALRWGVSGAIIEWVLVMRRFAQEALLDDLAARGALDVTLMADLADAVAQFHERAERVDQHGGRQGMRWVIEGNAESFARLEPMLGTDLTASVTARCRGALSRHGDLLDARRCGGFVRRCHGDLHLRNIVLLDGRPTLFDAVEFNDEISCVDVLYDLAFLLMDLLRRHLPVHANAVFNGYLSIRPDLVGLPLLPLFLGCRAAIRAKTAATAAGLQPIRSKADALASAAREYLAMAERLLQPASPVLLAIGGFSGSGKSTVAQRIAPRLGASPGALVLRSDVIRKSLFGVAAETRLGPQAYGADTSAAVYRLIADRASLALAAGHSVIADAVYADPAARDAIARVAARAHVPFAGLWLDTDATTLARRIGQRSADASDATTEVLGRQLRAGAGLVSWERIDATGDPEATERSAWRTLQPVLQPAGPD